MAEPQQPTLERELAEARRRGRWLSDEERQLQQRSEQEQAQRLAQVRQQRYRLLVLLGVCLLLPPFWPLALGLTAYLLFPRTTLHLGVVALALLVLLGVGLAALITALILWL